MTFPTEWKNKIHVPNHQPEYGCILSIAIHGILQPESTEYISSSVCPTTIEFNYLIPLYSPCFPTIHWRPSWTNGAPTHIYPSKKVSLGESQQWFKYTVYLK
jgi:hypothetical protein